MRARLDNDGIRLTGVTGDIDVRSANGGVTVRGSGDGTLALRSDNGNVTGTDLRASVVDAHSDNGNVSLAFHDAPTAVEATGDNGPVTVDRARRRYHLRRHHQQPGRVDRGPDPHRSELVPAHHRQEQQRRRARHLRVALTDAGWGCPHPHDAGSHHGRLPSPSVRSTGERTRRIPREEQP